MPRRGESAYRPRPGVLLWLTCSCGSSLRGTVSSLTAAIEMRDVWLSFHKEDGCTVTDKSEDVP